MWQHPGEGFPSYNGPASVNSSLTSCVLAPEHASSQHQDLLLALPLLLPHLAGRGLQLQGVPAATRCQPSRRMSVMASAGADKGP